LLKKGSVENNGRFTDRASVLWSSIMKLVRFVYSIANDKKLINFTSMDNNWFYNMSWTKVKILLFSIHFYQSTYIHTYIKTYTHT
jgi:hypothetical protein